MINIMTGNLNPNMGQMKIFGYDGADVKRLRELIAVVPQFDTFFDDMTVEEHLTLVARLHHTSRNLIEGFCKKSGVNGYSEFKLKYKEYLEGKRDALKDDGTTELKSFMNTVRSEEFQNSINRRCFPIHTLTNKAAAVVRIANKTDIIRTAFFKFGLGWICVTRSTIFRTAATTLIYLTNAISARSRNHIGTTDTLAARIACLNH